MGSESNDPAAPLVHDHEHPSYCVFVDLGAEGERDDVREAWTTIAGITLFQLDNGVD